MMLGVIVLLLLALVGGAVFGAVRMFGSGQQPAEGGARNLARRVVLYALLFLLVTLGGIGVAGLLGLVIPEAGRDIAGSDSLELARSLAFTLIAGPIAAGLWSYLWKRVDATERASVGWALYVASMGGISLVVATTSLLSTASSLVDGEWHSRTFAVGIVWTAICLWHRWMYHHPTRSPVRLTDLLPVAGSSFGLVVTAGGAVALLTSLVDQALFTPEIASGRWWEFPLQAVIWTAGGGFVWWWYRDREGAAHFEGAFADTANVVVGTAAPVLAAMSGAIAALYVALRWAFETTSLEDVGAGLPAAVAALLVGGGVWSFHRGDLERRITARRIGALLVAGFGLIAAASGIGVIVNAGLEAVTQSLAETDRLGLLFGGLSALVVGAPVWFLNWKPTADLTDDRAAFSARSVYLVAVFGASALTALVTLLVIVYRVFVYVLESGTGFIDEVRAPFGLLLATGLVAAYHYPVWKRDRSIAATIEAPQRIEHVILVTGTDPEPLRRVIVDATGAMVTVWKRSDSHDDGLSTEHLAEALSHAAGKRVMVVTGPGAHLEVIPLEG